MARTPFKMRSGNSTPFKQMGSSPMRLELTEAQMREQGMATTGVKDAPPPPPKTPKKKGTDWAAIHEKAGKKDPRYAKMTQEEYKAEALRQSKAYKESGGTIKEGKATGGKWDAMGTEIKTKPVVAKEEVVKPKEEVVTSEVVKPTKETKATTVPKTVVGNIGRKISNWARSKAGTPEDRASFVGKPTKKSMKKQVISEIEKMGVSGKEAKKLYKTSKKAVKKEQKVAKKASTSKVKAARAKYGRGSAEVIAAKAERRKVRKGEF